MSSFYPNQFDTDANLYLVHDGLRVSLAEDYLPGDTSITVNLDPILSRFPSTGILTLTEQCGDIDKRAISFTYSAVDAVNGKFTGLSLLAEFDDVPKPKRLTDVTLNVVAPHHNALKDALIAIEGFVGRKGEVARGPLVGTMEQRINYLRRLVLKPKAWFNADTHVGVVPLTVNFADLSLRAPVKYVWDYGDDSSETLTFPYIPGQAEETSDTAPPDGSISHIYTTPGLYDVTLTVTNPFGTDAVTIKNFINAKTLAPDPATITFNPMPTQTVVNGVIRSRINTPIEIDVLTSGEQALDPITKYTWSMSDDLQHASMPKAEARYSIGGAYDVSLRVDTQLEAYRITTFPQVIDIVEKHNLWMTVFDPNVAPNVVTQNAYTFEFGLLSEVFKIKAHMPLSISRDSSFLSAFPNASQQQREFLRNNGFTARTLTASGDQGTAILYWAEGASTVRIAELNGFTDVYASPAIGSGDNSFSRDWNWVSLNSPSTVYFLFGVQSSSSPVDLTNPNMQELDLGSLTVAGTLLKANDFENGADELLTNVGDGTDGEFSVCRSCWKNSTGYIVRNDGTGQFFRLKSFYRTEGVLADPVKLFRKLPDLPGATKFEGQLVPLTGGVYFFNNTGEVSVYDPIGNVWASGGPGLNSPAFSSLQDTSVAGFDSASNTLVAVGDGDRVAYLSYDYSPNAFIKFNDVDLTFTQLPNRPAGEQFGLLCY